VTIQHPTAVTKAKLLVTATDGRLLQTVAANSGAQQTSLDISSLRPGSYFIRYEDGSGMAETIKISKQ
jgi:hypothetical protein